MRRVSKLSVEEMWAQGILDETELGSAILRATETIALFDVVFEQSPTATARINLSLVEHVIVKHRKSKIWKS